MTRRNLVLVFAALLVLIAAARFVLPALLRADVRFVPHTDPALCAVAGMVVDEAGRPAAGVKVVWCAAEAGDTGLWGSQLFRSTAEMVTGADGSFRFEPVSPVDGFVTIDGNDLQVEGRSGELTPRPGFVATALQVVAKAIPASRRLSGRLQDPQGAPIAFAPIQVRAESWLTEWQNLTTTDAEGRFELSGPWSGVGAELTWLPVGGEPQPLGTAVFGEEVRLTSARPR
jgi:hypothetical protein